jgi:hypothetical protein
VEQKTRISAKDAKRFKAFRDSMVEHLSKLVPPEYTSFPNWEAVISGTFEELIRRDEKLVRIRLSDAFLDHVTEVRHHMCEKGFMDIVVTPEGNPQYIMTDKGNERFEKKEKE